MSAVPVSLETLPQHISSSIKSRVDLLLGIWIKEVNMLLRYPYWLPIQRCQISFYSQKLSSSQDSFPSYTFTGDSESPNYLLFYVKAKKTVTGKDDCKIVNSNLDFENLKDPPCDLNCLGARLVLEVSYIYEAYLQVFGKTKQWDFASHFYFDKKKFQEQLDQEVIVGFQEEASNLL